MPNNKDNHRQDDLPVEGLEKRFYHDPDQNDISEADVLSSRRGVFKWLLILFIAIPVITYNRDNELIEDNLTRALIITLKNVSKGSKNFILPCFYNS